MKKLFSLLMALCLLCAALPVVAENANSDRAAAIRAKFLEKADEVVVTDTSVIFTDAVSETPLEITKNPGKTAVLYGRFVTLWYEAGGKADGVIGGSSSIELYELYIGRDVTQDEGVTVLAESSAGKNWNTENIIAFQPDLIVCSTAMSGYKTISAPAQAAGIPVVAMSYNDFSDYLKWFKVFCNLNGQPELWDTVAMPALDKARGELNGADLVLTSPHAFLCDRLRAGLSRTREQIGGGLGGLTSLFSRRKIDEELLEELETTLLMADCGVEATQHLLKELRLRWKRDKLETADQLQGALAEGLLSILQPLEQPLEISGHKPYIIMIAGVNGSGKTTSIGKLAKHFQSQGKSVLLAAGDTFRAAAREQLMTWGERNGVAVIAQESGDPAAVVFDAINAARARNIDIVLADTAGRLPTQLHLMEEIAKVRRVVQKAEPTGPHEVLLVLDANIGQNALQQVKAFDAAIGVTGLVVTKLDGTAKGGVVAAIARQCPKPLRFIGVGEQIDDLQTFRAKEFVDALFGNPGKDEQPG